MHFLHLHTPQDVHCHSVQPTRYQLVPFQLLAPRQNSAPGSRVWHIDSLLNHGYWVCTLQLSSKSSESWYQRTLLGESWIISDGWRLGLTNLGMWKYAASTFTTNSATTYQMRKFCVSFNVLDYIMIPNQNSHVYWASVHKPNCTVWKFKLCWDRNMTLIDIPRLTKKDCSPSPRQPSRILASL